MGETAIVSVVLGGFSVLTWLLGLSYFLGRNTAKLDGLADGSSKMEATIKQIFEKLEVLTASVPHRCDQVQAIAEIRVQVNLSARRLEEMESWRHSIEKAHD